MNVTHRVGCAGAFSCITGGFEKKTLVQISANMVMITNTMIRMMMVYIWHLSEQQAATRHDNSTELQERKRYRWFSGACRAGA
jgi:hypothetical protein